MHSANRLILVCLAWLTVALAGCATLLPSTSTDAPATSSVAVSKPEPVVNLAVQRDFTAALSAMKLGRYQDAERMLVSLTRAHPEFPGPYANLGIVYSRMGKLTEAADALEKAIGINPDRAAYYNLLGIVYRQGGQLDKAREAYSRALQVDSSYLNSHLNLGILYDLYLQDRDKALQHYERYQALLPAADTQVNKWIVDLKQRQHSSDKTALRSDR